MRQRLQHLGIGDDKFRRIKRADKIFALRQIHAGFAANRAVDLRHKRRGDMHQPHAAQVRCRRKPATSPTTPPPTATTVECRSAPAWTSFRVISSTFARRLADSASSIRMQRFPRPTPSFRCNRPAPVAPHARRRNHKQARRLAQLADQRCASRQRCASAVNVISSC